MSEAAVPAAAPATPPAGLRANTLAALVMLLFQYGLGVGANLYATLPTADHGKDLLSALGPRSGSWSAGCAPADRPSPPSPASRSPRSWPPGSQAPASSARRPTAH